MTLPHLLDSKCERIKAIAGEALATTEMFAGFKYHTPTMSYYDAVQAAANLRATADELDKLAERFKPEGVVHLQAAE